MSARLQTGGHKRLLGSLCPALFPTLKPGRWDREKSVLFYSSQKRRRQKKECRIRGERE